MFLFYNLEAISSLFKKILLRYLVCHYLCPLLYVLFNYFLDNLYTTHYYRLKIYVSDITVRELKTKLKLNGPNYNQATYLLDFKPGFIIQMHELNLIVLIILTIRKGKINKRLKYSIPWNS